MGEQEHNKTKAVRLQRLRRRMDEVTVPITADGARTLVGVVKALLELLEGEL